MSLDYLKVCLAIVMLAGCASEPPTPKTPEQIEHERQQNLLAQPYFSGTYLIRAANDDELKLGALEIKGNGKQSQVLYYKAGSAVAFRTDQASCSGALDGESPRFFCFIEQNGQRPLAIFIDHVKVDTVAKPDKTFVLNPLLVKANEFKIQRVDLQIYSHAFYAASKKP